MTYEPIDRTTSGTNFLEASESFSSERPVTEVRLADGRVLRLPTVLLLEHLSPSQDTAAPQLAQTTDEPISIPVIEEQLSVGKRTVVTSTVRLDKHVGVYDEELNIPLAVRSFEVERVPLNQPVDTAPGVRQEGNTTIYPLVEEQLILTKQLILREEVRVTRRDTERHDTRTVSLRRESIEVTRI